MKKKCFIAACLILLHFFTISCSHQYNLINKTEDDIFNIKNKGVTINDFITLTRRLLNKIADDDYFKDKNKSITLYFNKLNNQLVDDNDETNNAIKNITLKILESLKNVKISEEKRNDVFLVDMNYFLSEVSYSKWQKTATALNANLYFYDNKYNEIKAWNDYLIKSEDFNIWQ